MRHPSRLFPALALVASAASACSGGDAPSSTADAGSTSSSGDASVDRPEERVDAGSGSTWTDLYRDFFGPTGAASCAGDGNCHGTRDTQGALGSQGYVCADKDGCWASMTAASPGLVTTADATDPTKSTLYVTLRHRRSDGSLAGSMPQRPSYVFSVASMDRIASWIQRGAKND